MIKPTIGRVVHYVHETTGDHYAAIITRVWTDTMVNLVIFDCEGQATLLKTSVVYNEYYNNYSWHWPERAE